ILYRYALRIKKTNLHDMVLDRDNGIIYSMNEMTLFLITKKDRLIDDPLTLESKNIIRKWMRIYGREVMTELRKWVAQFQKHPQIIDVLSDINYDHRQLINSINTLSHIDLIQILV